MKYTVYKLGRKQDPEMKTSPRIYDGKQFSGAKLNTMKVNEDETQFLTGMAESFENLEDLVGHAAYFSGTTRDALIRTSVVRSVYKHGDGPEINLPEGFPESDLENMEYPELKEGDVLVATMNSIYLAQAE